MRKSDCAFPGRRPGLPALPRGGSSLWTFDFRASGGVLRPRADGGFPAGATRAFRVPIRPTAL